MFSNKKNKKIKSAHRRSNTDPRAAPPPSKPTIRLHRTDTRARFAERNACRGRRVNVRDKRNQEESPAVSPRTTPSKTPNGAPLALAAAWEPFAWEQPITRAGSEDLSCPCRVHLKRAMIAVGLILSGSATCSIPRPRRGGLPFDPPCK